jgi:hypothetical protein
LGKRGLVRWIDLANVDSVMAVQTLDVAERTEQGFRLIGRLPRTEPRGCSLSAEDLMGSRRPPGDGSRTTDRRTECDGYLGEEGTGARACAGYLGRSGGDRMHGRNS